MVGEANIWQPGTAISANTKSVSQTFTALAGQALFTLTSFAYAVGTGALEVHKNGKLLTPGVEWVEQTSSTFYIVAACTAGDTVVATGKVGTTADVDVRDTDIFVTNYQAIRDYAGTEITLYAQGAVTLGDTGEAFFQEITGAAPGFYVDNNSTILVPTGGDGSIGWVRTAKAIDVTFETVTAAVASASPPAVGVLSNTKGRLAAGDGYAADYLVMTPGAYGLTPDELGAAFTLTSANILVLQTGSDLPLGLFAAAQDGSTDDAAKVTAAVVLAASAGLELVATGDIVLSSQVPGLGDVVRRGNYQVIQSGLTYDWDTSQIIADPKKKFYSEDFDSAAWDEVQAENGDYHAFPMITQNGRGTIVGSWMHQTQHTGSVAADVVCKVSIDGGANWSALNIIYGTLNGSGDINPFYNVLGIDRHGRFVNIFNKYASNPGNAPSLPWITRSWDGFNWSAPVQVTFSGDAITETSTIVPFGEIKLLPSGKLALAIYQGTPTDSHYIAVIDDDVDEVDMELRLIAAIGDYSATTISFTNPNTISDSANGLGFLSVGERFNTSSTSGLNDRANTVVSTGAGSITVAETVTTETAGAAGTVVLELDYNEMVFVPLTETIWFAFLRQAGITNEIPYYTSTDAGATWTWQGNLGAGLSGGWIPQAAERVTIDDTPHILLAVGLRDSATDPAGYTITSMQYFICPALEAIDNSGQWNNIHELAFVDDAFDRDLYSGQIIDNVTGEILVIAHEETATDESRIVTGRFNYREKASNTITSHSLVLEGTGGTPNTYSVAPTVNIVKRGKIGFMYGSLVLSAINTTGPLTLTGFPYTNQNNNNIVINASYYNTVGVENHLSLRSIANTKTFALIEGNANSNIDSSEVNATFNLRFSGIFFTDD